MGRSSMTPRRLIANALTALVLAALVALVLFAYLSTRVVPEPERVVIEQEIEFRRLP